MAHFMVDFDPNSKPDYFDSDSPEIRDWARTVGEEFNRVSVSVPLEMLEEKMALYEQMESLKLQWIRKRIAYSRTATRTAPIRRVPSELLERIFLDPVLLISFSQAQEDLLSIRLTCRRWNQVAIECPRLWSTIDLVPWMYGRGKLWSLSQLSTWVSRSGNVPLEITVTPYGISNRSLHYDLRTDPNLPSLVDPLLARTHRWNSLRVDNDASLFIVSTLENKYPAAREADVRGPLPSTAIRSTWNFPSLRRFGADGGGYPFLFNPRFDATNLHSLHITCANYYSMTEYAEIVSATPNVVDLWLRSSFKLFEPYSFKVGTTEDNTNISHPRLQYLRFGLKSIWSDIKTVPFLWKLMQGSSNLEVLKVDDGEPDTDNGRGTLFGGLDPHAILSLKPFMSVKWLEYTVWDSYSFSDYHQGAFGYRDEEGPFLKLFPNLHRLDFKFRISSPTRGRQNSIYLVGLSECLPSLDYIKAFSLDNVIIDGLPLVELLKSLASKNPELVVGMWDCQILEGDNKVIVTTRSPAHYLNVPIPGQKYADADTRVNGWCRWTDLKAQLNQLIPGIWEDDPKPE